MGNYIIAISRQLGAGGSITGKAIAEKLGFRYMDNELLAAAAEEFGTTPEDMKMLEESMAPIWSTVLNTTANELPYMTESWYMPTGRQLFEVQTEILRKAVEEGPCVIVGRCGGYIFREEEKCVSLRFYADEESRLQRLSYKEIFRGPQGAKELQKEDKNRARYFNTYTGKKWYDMENYDICINTGKLKDEEIVEMSLQYIYTRFPELEK